MLVETGTYLGDMVDAMRADFEQVISIELSEELAQHARARFARASNVQVLCGDSGKLLPEVVSRLMAPTLFWLDGHYSAGVTAKGDRETPILEELEAIFSGSTGPHVLLIDDARCFGSGDYPSIQQVQALVMKYRPGWQFAVAGDIIRICPPVSSVHT
jgi:hypothetical protein